MLTGRVFVCVQIAVAGAGLAVAAAAAGQTPPAAKAMMPYSPDGRPNLEGFWGPGGISAHEDIERGSDPLHNTITKEQLRPISVIVDPPSGLIPYQPWAAARKKEIYDNRGDPKPEHLDPSARCFLLGVPRMAYYFSGFRILQPGGQVVLLTEAMHAYRIVTLAPRPQVGEAIKLWMGDSRGRWEGDTLVVEVTNNNAGTWFDWAGNFHSDALTVVERWTPIDANTIAYRATMTDPKVYTRPWTLAFNLVRNTQPGYESFEEACHEGNRSPELSIRQP